MKWSCKMNKEKRASSKSNDSTIFNNGSKWLKMDLHLHTNSDNSFHYSGSNFIKDYVNGLKKESINIAAITNHNQFDYTEYSKLSEECKKEEIWLLPGVELTVNDGKYGLHVLILFDDLEIKKKYFINDFLTIVFESNDRFDSSSNPLPCKFGLPEIINKLDSFGYDYIFIPAHVDNDKGFFKSFSSVTYKKFIEKNYFRDKIVAFQNINESSKRNFETALKEVYGDSYRSHIPAYVTYSDAKKIEELGKNPHYVKLGCYDFKTLKFAFLNHELRLSSGYQDDKYPLIKSVQIESGNFIKRFETQFNRSLNTIIGIRGSGKSTVLELIRWCFGLQPNEDDKYKEQIIKNALGNSGKVTVNIISKDGYEYKIEKYAGDNYEKVFNDKNELTQLKALSGLFNLNYYGQRDLAKISQDYGKISIIDDFIKDEIDSLRKKEKNILSTLDELINDLKDNQKFNYDIEQLKEELEVKSEQKRKFEEKKADTVFKEQANYEKDNIKIDQIKSIFEEIKNELGSFKTHVLEKFDSVFKMKFNVLKSSDVDFINAFRKNIITLIGDLEKLINDSIHNYPEQFKSFLENMEKVKEKTRQLSEDFNKDNIDSNFYFILEKDIEKIRIKIDTLDNINKKIRNIKNELDNKIVELTKVRRDIYSIRRNKAKELEGKINFVQLDVIYRDNEESFLEFLSDRLSGKRISKQKSEKLIKKYKSGYEIVKAVEGSDDEFNDILTPTETFSLRERIEEYYHDFFTFQPDDRLNIKYKSHEAFKEFEHLSIGQRAAALLGIILSEGCDPLIIDQPEDDIDNNTLYEGIIHLLHEQKNSRQFILATHNSNIVVLGDSENVIICHSDKDEFKGTNNSIDTLSVQHEIINIMEGGKDAFEKRKLIYQLWS